MIQPYLFKATIPHKGIGVFTSEKIRKNTILEIAPVIVLSLKDKKHLDKTLLHDYLFMWGREEKECCMALGWVPLYNHSYASNCEYLMNFETNEIAIQTVRLIHPNEELTINYNGSWNDEKKVWFEVV
jgi:uncharacterized protein